jgi:hypothetical protein
MNLFIIYKTVSSSITYPLSVVSTVSTVSGSGLLAGSYPKMVYHASWIEAFKNLYENVSLKMITFIKNNVFIFLNYK